MTVLVVIWFLWGKRKKRAFLFLGDAPLFFFTATATATATVAAAVFAYLRHPERSVGSLSNCLKVPQSCLFLNDDFGCYSVFAVYRKEENNL